MPLLTDSREAASESICFNAFRQKNGKWLAFIVGDSEAGDGMRAIALGSDHLDAIRRLMMGFDEGVGFIVDNPVNIDGEPFYLSVASLHLEHESEEEAI